MLTQENMQALVDGIRVAQEGRRTALVSLRKEVADARDGASESLRALTRSRRRSAEQERAGRAEAEAQRAKEARGWLGDVAEARRASAADLRAALAGGRAALGADVHAFLEQLERAHQEMAQQERAGRAEAEALRAKEAREWLGDVAETRQGVQAAWATLTVRPGSSRLAPDADIAAQAQAEVTEVAAAAPTPATAPGDAPPGGAHAAEEAGPADDAEEEAEEAETGEAPAETLEPDQEFAALRERVVSLLADHPDGVRLVEIEQQFGLNRFESQRVVNSLIEEGKARRRDRLYFAQ